jgi:transcriptional regulator with XRE-family HTH domain
MLIAKESRRPKEPLHQDPVAVRQARQARGLTQAQLGDEVGISIAHVSEIEGGTRNARPELLERIAGKLDVPVKKLERKRRLVCPRCKQGYDPQPNYRVPLHTLPDSAEWCPAGGQPEQEAAA